MEMERKESADLQQIELSKRFLESKFREIYKTEKTGELRMRSEHLIHEWGNFETQKESPWALQKSRIGVNVRIARG